MTNWTDISKNFYSFISITVFCTASVDLIIIKYYQLSYLILKSSCWKKQIKKTHQGKKSIKAESM